MYMYSKTVAGVFLENFFFTEFLIIGFSMAGVTLTSNLSAEHERIVCCMMKR